MVNSVSSNAQGATVNSSAATGGAGAAGSAGTSNNSVSGSMGKDAFLQLLCTQLQYQDPLQPADNSQFVAQLAQFSALEGITNLGTTMQSVLNGITSLQNYTAASFIGKNVTADGNSFVFSGSPVTLGYNLSSNAADVSLSIQDASGKVLRNVDLGSKQSGQYQLTWDGTDASGATVAPGNYTFAVSATDSNKAAVSASTLISGPVTGVSFNNDGTANLTVAGTTIPRDSVTSIY